MPVGVMGIWLEIVPWTETRLERGRKGRKVKGKECGEEKVVRVIGKEKGREILVEKGIKETPKEKERGRTKVDPGGPQPGEKDTRGIVTSVERHKAGEGLCKIQEMTTTDGQVGTACDAVEIGSIWNVCSVDTENQLEPPPRPWRAGTHRMSPGNLFGKQNGGTRRFNRFEA